MFWCCVAVLFFLLSQSFTQFCFAATPQTPPTQPAAQADGKKDESAKHVPDQVDTWESVWASQRDMLNEINEKAAIMREKFAKDAAGLTKKTPLFEEEARRLLVLVNNFQEWPNPMEAVSRRIASTMLEERQDLEPLILGRAEVQALLDRVSYLADSLPEDVRGGRVDAEMQAYVKDIAQAKSRLAAVLAKYDSSLGPYMTLLERLEKTRADIASRLPVLWKDYYLQDPVPWLSLETWEEIPQNMRYSVQSMVLRQAVEMPVAAEQWVTAGLRFALCLCFTCVAKFLLGRRLLTPTSSPAGRHIFQISLPCLCLGFSLAASSISTGGEFFRLLLALGNLGIIAGQIFLAWDMRLLKNPEAGVSHAPLWRLMPLTFCAYTLLYLPLAKPLTLVLWTALVAVSLVRLRRQRAEEASSLQLECGILECEPVALWFCLALSLLGLHIYSMTLYLFFVSSSLALELCLGSMGLISEFNGRLPSEGARAAVAHLLIALAAPVVLVTAVTGVLLWVGTLPGGMYLLKEYVLKGVNVGATQFNIIQLLLIISAFYLTRAAVSMGTRLLSKLPGQGLEIDSTLIPPMQTALTYLVWCFFGLFALRSLGMELSNLAMVAGGLSVGIGLGMQTIVNNFISGLILIFSRTLQAGDVVEVDGVTGRVRKISVRATMVETYDNALIYVPNSEFVSSRLTNWTRNSRSVRREISLGVAYGSNTELVMKLMLGIASGHRNVLKYPAPSIAFADFGVSTLDFSLHFWVKDYDVGVSTSSDIRLEIEKQFRQHRIEVAFPQMDLHIKEMPPRVKIPQQPAERRGVACGRLKRPASRGTHYCGRSKIWRAGKAWANASVVQRDSNTGGRSRGERLAF
ncbi:mechanosensitive ion channel protein [Deltaproteobacteria bacterium]|nr:mechanosensitive ion channel protein [Deltaproteobacteria bacterium]